MTEKGTFMMNLAHILIFGVISRQLDDKEGIIVRFKNDFYREKYICIGIVGLSFLAKVPWENICSVTGIFFLIMVVIGVVSIIESMFNF